MKDHDRPLPHKVSLSQISIKLTLFLLAGMFFLPLLVYNSDHIHRFVSTPGDFSFSLQRDSSSSAGFPFSRQRNSSSSSIEPILRLIQQIRKAVQVAAQGSDISFSAADRDAWERENPCRSRAELKPLYERRKYVKDAPVNKQWQMVLDEYAVLHRVCMSKIGDPKNYFLSQNVSTGCKFLLVEAHFGLGNKILHMSSLLVYAVLTQRVMLIPSSTSVPLIVCEPFPGSRWQTTDDLLRMVQSHRQTSDQLYDAMDHTLSDKIPLAVYASKGSCEWGPEIRFWCRTEQELFSEVTWLTFDGCLYFLPKLFAIAQFRPILEALFPGKVVLTHVLRTVMLPGDQVWERVLHTKEVDLGNAERQIGVQVRYLHGERQYKRDNAMVNEHITDCLWENDILPKVCPTTPMIHGNFANCSGSPPPNPPVTKVLVASLFLGFYDHLNSIYLGRQTPNREKISLVQLTHEKTQGTGVEVDSQALVEIIALSLSDVLLITPMSTFGGVAQAYGALIPYIIEYLSTGKNKCERYVTSEPCYLGAIEHYDCRYDSPKQKAVVEIVPYLQRCIFIDVGAGYGMLMVNDG